MRKIFFVLILINNCIVSGQEVAFDKDYFRNKLNTFKTNHPNCIDFKNIQSLQQYQINEQSVLLLKPSAFANPYNKVQPIGYRMKKLPEKIDYDNLFMQCGPLQPRNSKI